MQCAVTYRHDLVDTCWAHIIPLRGVQYSHVSNYDIILKTNKLYCNAKNVSETDTIYHCSEHFLGCEVRVADVLIGAPHGYVTRASYSQAEGGHNRVLLHETDIRLSQFIIM